MAEKTEEAQKPETSKKNLQNPENTTPAKKKGGVFIFIIFIFATAGLGISAYVAQQGVLLRKEVSTLTIELSQLRLLDQQPIIQELTKEINAQNIRQKNLEETINQRFKNWQINLEKTQSLAERKKDDWILNEVAYLMRMASTRLHLASDINSSTAALTLADLRLNELENPRYLPIRKILADEISELQSLRKPDIDGTTLKIERLMNNLPTLPDAIVKQDKEQATTLIKKESGKTKNILYQILDYIGIKENSGTVPTLATHQNVLFLDQLIRLELESAKQELIRYKSEGFNNHLKRARTLIKEHYKQDHKSVIEILSEIDNIIDNKIFPELPDITRSLNLLQSMLNKYKTPEKTNKPSDKPVKEKVLSIKEKTNRST